MLKTKNKKTKTKLKPLSENQFGVILEDINSKVGLILEGHSALNQKIDDFKEEFVEFKQDTESNFKTIFKYLSSIDDELKSIKSEVSDIKKTLSRKADLDRVALLEERVANLERQLAAASRDPISAR